jgi:two-component system, LuxR family, sensor kinase FixL
MNDERGSQRARATRRTTDAGAPNRPAAGESAGREELPRQTAQAAALPCESGRKRWTVLDALPMQIAVLDASGRILAVNEAWRRFARENGGDATLEEGIGIDYLASCRGVAAADPDGLGEQALAGIRAVMEGEQSAFSLVYPCHNADQQRWFLMTVTPMGAAANGVVVTHADISARMLAEQENRRRRDEVARIARLSSVTVLAGSLVHELAQPLAAASLYGESLVALGRREHVDRTQVLAVVDELRGQVDRAIGIVGGLRRFIRSGELKAESCDLEKPIREAIALVTPLARRKLVRLKLDLPQEPVRAMVNPLQIEQVLFNLLCNGIEAIDRAGCAARTVGVQLRAANGLAMVTVMDSGPGVSPEWSSRIFEVFETEKEAGMGMGLTVSRTIIEAHGGALWAEPDGTSGAILRFTLPLSTDEDTA